ncbi:MAG: short-chain dehydrogenase [Betaproteobacteria bacterium SG8_40]|nr:MAG: short-chain dehydrogenase [Betaproteobacteria bacterium SG8_40]
MSIPKSVVITGASSGIGRALAIEYARRGATLGLIARRSQLLDELAAALPVASYCYPVDVRDAGGLSEAAQDFVDRAGCPDIVIAGAGVSAGTLTADPGDSGVFEEILSINVTGMMRTFQPFVDLMRGQRRGVLAGIASVAGFRGLPGASAYCASKSAAITYLESLRLEMRQHGVRVVTICPGYVVTPMTAVNPYPMPFMIDADRAARIIADAIASGKRFHVLPWQMALVGWLLRHLPRPVYDAVFMRAPRKPRRSET